MNYESLIDAETWSFIQETERLYPVEIAGYSIVQQRQTYDQMCRAFFQGYPDGVTSRDWHPVRNNSKMEPQSNAIYFHDGGFVVGGLESHDDVRAEICDRTGFRVVSIDYHLAPELKHPAMFEDVKAATENVLTSFDGPVCYAAIVLAVIWQPPLPARCAV